MAARRTIVPTGVGLISAVCTFLLLLCTPTVTSLARSFSSDKSVVEVSYFPNSHRGLGFRGKLSKPNLKGETLDMLQLKDDDLGSYAFRQPDEVSQFLDNLRNDIEIPHFRRKRDVTQETTNESVPENRTGTLIDFTQKFSSLSGRQFSLNSSSVHPEMFELSSDGRLTLKADSKLDYEDESMRSIVFVVHAQSRFDTADLYEITATLTVTNVDEPPEFVTEPQPFLATIGTNTGAGTPFITVRAVDPEGAQVEYEKSTVFPFSFNDRIELRTETINGQRQCQLRTVGSGSFPDGQTITISVSARDSLNGGQETKVTVSLLVGVRPPQFYQSKYHGSMQEKNQPQQTVYKLGSSSEELRVQWKTFQPGAVSLSLMSEGGGESELFDIDNSGSIFCLKELDYETTNPKVQALTLTATQRVDTVDFSSNVSVTVQIEDTNDNSPLFDKSQYLRTEAEDIAVGQAILRVTASDADTGINAQIDYSLINTEDFEIETLTEGTPEEPVYVGVLKVKRKLDYDRPQGPIYSFKVQATDRGTPKLSSTSNVRVTVTNINDEHPQFTIPSGETFQVLENANVGHIITQIQATDKDGDVVTYSFNSGSQLEGKFSINNVTGLVKLTSTIDDSDDIFTLDILATDDGSCCGGTTQLTNTTQIFVQVTGVNTQKPTFTACSTYNPSVDEHSDIGTLVIQVSAVDNDRGPNGEVTYFITQPQGIFKINSSSGDITVNSDIDRETSPEERVTVRGRDGGNPTLEGWCTFRVTINDINDNTPTFDQTQYIANITIELQPRVSFVAIRAYDNDVGDNARISYSLVDDAQGKFGIIEENGFIYLNEQLTETNVQFNLVAMAKDAGSPSLNSTVNVQINVKTGTARPPIWDQSYNAKTYTVNESVPEGFAITVPAMNCISNISDPRVLFTLIRPSTDYFFIQSAPNSNSVIVHALGNFDFAEDPEHIIRISCTNFGQGVTLSSEVNPKVVLTDTNNQIPQFEGLESDNRYNPEVQENKPAGTSVMTIVATDKDATLQYSQISFSIEAGGENFTIEPGPQRNTAILKTRSEFDREKQAFYYVTVKAEDGAESALKRFAPGPNTASVNIRVKITDVNDNAPYFKQSVYRIEVNESYYINELIYPAIQVDDPDESDRGRHNYRINADGNGSPPTFGVRNRLGNLFLLRKLDYESGDKFFNLLLEADDGKFSANTTVEVTVLDVNDNNPLFKPDNYVISNITENDYSVPKVILLLTATDADVDRPTQISYSLQGSSFNVDEYFRIDPITGVLSVIKALDRDLPDGRPDYQFTVVARDEPVNPNFGYATVSVRPKDLNDNAPEFITDPLEGTVDEHSPSGTSVMLILAEDRDFGDNGTVEFEISNIVDGSNVNRPDYFVIGQDQGLISTNTEPDNLDRETQDTYRLTVVLRDKGTPQQQTTGTVTVKLDDINDNHPIFQQSVYSVQMSENLLPGFEVTRVKATDADIGDNARIFYTLNEQDTVFFSIQDIENEGSIQVFSPVDYETDGQQNFTLTVFAKDKSGQGDSCTVHIEVLDFNDNAPEIQPDFAKKNVSEDVPVGTYITSFTATDADSGVNAKFEFSISRESDPKRQFSIDPVSGDVKTRRKLDRETQALHVLTIQAIDEGDPPLTGTATLSVVVDDVNDNYPTFKEDYQPQVLEGEGKDVLREVQEILAKDPDAPPYSYPFGFKLTECAGGSCPCDVRPTCDQFQFTFNQGGDNGNGSATIRTDRQFDREAQKYYKIPIIMWDMRGTGSPEAMTGTNTLTVTIADINDNEMSPGHQDMFVYNYKGMFGPVDIGRVYVEDKDDWDLPDKFFNFSGPAWMESYFKVDYYTGMVTMQKGVPSNTAATSYNFKVDVFDKHWQQKVTSSISVVIHDLSEEAVRNSGAVRLKETSAEDFIKKTLRSSGGNALKSPYDEFQQLLAEKLNTDLENVQIISVQDVEGGFTDVRYSAHGSPYYPSSQTDSLVLLNKAEFEQKLGMSVEEVPIDACAEEVFEGGCYNYMDITGQPALVNANGTSFVGVEVFIRAMEGCRALDFPEPNECSGDYCYHGGTCVKDDFGVLSCQNCPEGFEGPRCQQLRHSFDGNSYAFYPTLEQCEDSETSIEFITEQADGLLFYNGPMADLTGDQPRDFIALELRGGLPVLTIDHGSGSTALMLDGDDMNGNNVISTLADGEWHKLEIVRKGKAVELIVDDCKVAGQQGSPGAPLDTKPCRAAGSTQGENTFLNVATLLQVGGRATTPAYPPNVAVPGAGFNGCVRNLIHNSKLYDLHYKVTPDVPSGENGCPREDEICGTTCGPNGICTATWIPQKATCVCKPGWRGNGCDTAATIRELKLSSYVQWQLKNSASLPGYELEVQVMYRTYDKDGVLFTVSTQDNTKSVILELRDGRLQALYNLGDGQEKLLLNNSQASNGQWHLARFKRAMHLATLTLDNGEGRNYDSRRDDINKNVYMTVDTNSPMFAGAIVTVSQGAEVIDRDLTDTCVQDIRLNNKYMPITSSENSGDLANHVKEKNVEACADRNGCVPPPNCPPNKVCVPLWNKYECRCGPGYREDDSGTGCISNCVPNPCFNDVTCNVNDTGVVFCTCVAPWYGQFCNYYNTGGDEDTAVGIAGGTVAAIVASIVVLILLLLLVFGIIMWMRRRRGYDDSDDKFVVEDDADFDIRENVMFYDEEGAGEEDQRGFDLAKLPNPVSETIRPSGPVPRVTERPRGHGVPDPADRPDVGDVLHGRLGDAEEDPDAPPYDTLITFNEEGSGSDAGSLSSLGSSSSDASQDYDYLNDWGPKFAKLADMYGAGQEPE